MPNKEKHELSKIDWPIIPLVNYKGCLVMKIIGGYSIFGQKCKTGEEVDALIEKSCNAIQNSIVNNDTPKDNNVQ